MDTVQQLKQKPPSERPNPLKKGGRTFLGEDLGMVSLTWLLALYLVIVSSRGQELVVRRPFEPTDLLPVALEPSL